MSTNIKNVADALYLSGCLKFGNFKIKSGATSPYYIDLARVLSSPEQLCVIVNALAEKIKQIMTSVRVDKLASIELKGALIVPIVACRLNLPCIIVRKEAKAYGITSRIAGADINVEDSVLFFDDVISEGLSKVEGIKSLQDLGANVKHILVVVNREHGGKESLEKLGYCVHALANVSEIVSTLRSNNRISEKEAEKVLNYVSGL